MNQCGFEFSFKDIELEKLDFDFWWAGTTSDYYFKLLYPSSDQNYHPKSCNLSWLIIISYEQFV